MKFASLHAVAAMRLIPRLALGLTLVSWLLPGLMTRADEGNVLWYRTPATSWQREALPIGNGRLGAMVFGSVPTDRIQFNEDSLWTGSESDTGYYQDFGDVYIDLTGQGAVTEYRRELDIGSAVQTVQYTCNGVHFKRDYFCSAPGQVTVIRLTSDKRGSYTGAIRLVDAHKAIPVGDKNRLAASGVLENGLKYSAQLAISSQGGSVSSNNSQLQFVGADSVTIYLAARTNYLNQSDKGWRGDDPEPRAAADLDRALASGYKKLRDDHLADYQPLFNRLALHLTKDGAGPLDLPTNERLSHYATGAKDPGLEQLFFDYGRYLLISSSRTGSLPANLQGIWNDSNTPMWRSDYHSNINIEMNYWPAEVTNLPECYVPFADYVESLRAVRTRETAKKFPGVRGWTVQTENGIFGGGSYTWNMPGSAWYCQSLWEHYSFTQDETYLRDVAYPILKEVTEFWVDRLKKLPDGTLVCPQGWSPEHGPVEDGVTYDQEIVYDLFGNYIAAAKVLNLDPDLCLMVESKRSHLLQPKIGRWGQIQEWMTDRDDPTDQHRHVSQLFALFPGHQISPVTTPKLAEAAKVSLAARGDGGTGWSKAWKIAYWSRLLDGNHAYKMLRTQLQLITVEGTVYSGGGTYSNLFDAHPPFQIDGNLGATAAMAEMLLQSQNPDEIDLLPALPDAWASGSIQGLRARGGYGVDLAWYNGRLTSARIQCQREGDCRIRYGDDVRVIHFTPGQIYQWTEKSSLAKNPVPEIAPY